MLLTSLRKEREQLINQGIEQGQQEEKYNMAKTLLLKGMTIPFIAEVTKLSEQEILQLKTNLDTQEKYKHEK